MPIIVTSSSRMRQRFWCVPPTDAPYSPATLERLSEGYEVACFRRSHLMATTIVAPGLDECVTSKMFSPKPLTEPWLENCSLMAASSVLSVTTKTGASLTRRVSSLGCTL